MVMVIWCVGVVGLFTPGVVVYPKAASSVNWKVGLKQRHQRFLAYDMTSILASVYTSDQNVTATPTSQPPDRATQNYTKISYLYILITLLPLNK